MVTPPKYIYKVNIREGEKLCKLKDNTGARSNGYKVIKDKFGLEIRRFRTIRRVKFGMIFQIIVLKVTKLNCFKLEFDRFMETII